MRGRIEGEDSEWELGAEKQGGERGQFSVR
jgi:hypothetical protein